LAKTKTDARHPLSCNLATNARGLVCMSDGPDPGADSATLRALHTTQFAIDISLFFWENAPAADCSTVVKYCSGVTLKNRGLLPRIW
jgi:hypothetical protein